MRWLLQRCKYKGQGGMTQTSTHHHQDAHRSCTCPACVLPEDDRTDCSRWQVGVAARLPSGPDNPNDLDYRAFWDFLVQKGQARGRMPVERLQGISYVAVR